MVSSEIRNLIDRTPFVDTHEHIWEETTRLSAPTGDGGRQPIRDFGIFFSHYSDSDLLVAGLDPKERDKIGNPNIDVDEKWRTVGPFYEKARHTGYLQNIRETVRMLYGEDDLREDNYRSISDRLAAMIKPGYYYPILRDVANIEYCQVNNLQTTIFMETQYPDLLCQDLSFVALSTGLNIEAVSKLANRDVKSLKDWHEVLDWCFATYGPRAIAVKNQSAYGRRIDYEKVSADDAVPLFEKYLANPKNLPMDELKAIQDHLFHYCVEKATEFHLPVKLHTGYYAGSGGMPLHRVRNNAGDMCELLKAHPKTPFVIMHITYPYQDEAIAIAKHYPNAYVDLCWAWIINPLASVRFVKEFLMAAPANKLLTFGGDYIPVEMVPGHAQIARKGLAQAISELVEEHWIDGAHVPALVARLMRGNAHELFDYEGTLKNWKTPSVVKKEPATVG
ncbi:MAG: amidohydrolase family protein [Candidatus Hydrogenedentes bacterium]|nr:amidohydrolase family protein [Candidatus Hydrogenedentota bacterium]